MDPQSQSFNPSTHPNESWRLQVDISRVQQVQAEHAERLLRLERRHDDDARMKSVWGTSSPFPSVLSGTPQQAPLQQPPSDQFRNFDDEANHLMSSLHLDADEEPRRAMGAASRANSVRFDETANQNHFSHSTRPSMDVFSRTSSGLGGIQMTERSYSHKSEGRASSVHSIRSAASGRANSLNLDSAYGLSDSNRSPLDMPTLAPGLMLLGAAPAIIRCWMNTNFKHDALLYAAVCTGSHRSFLSLRLLQKLGFDGIIRSSGNGPRTIELPIFFPEAIPHPGSSRSSSPTPQLPSLSVEFRVLEDAHLNDEGKSIQIFIGSDTLRAHNADILFSSNSMTIFDDDDHKLSIPLSRPENQAVFDSLYVTSESLQSVMPFFHPADLPASNGHPDKSLPSAAISPLPGPEHDPVSTVSVTSDHVAQESGATGSEFDSRPESRQSNASRPSLGPLNTRTENVAPATSDLTPLTATSRPVHSPAAWSSWRRDSSAPPASATPSSTAPAMDWASLGKQRDSYQRKDTGIKVLKPKTSSRAFSASLTPSAGPHPPASPFAASAGAANPDGKSRFFDEGRRRSAGSSAGLDAGAGAGSRVPSGSLHEGKKENLIGSATVPASANAVSSSSSSSTPKTKANPIGGASAFSWLNSGRK